MIIPGLNGIHILKGDVISKSCITKLVINTFRHGVKKGIYEYRQCIKGRVENFYNPNVYLFSSSMFGIGSKSEKPVSPVKQAKLDLKAAKKNAKAEKKAAKPASSSSTLSGFKVALSKFGGSALSTALTAPVSALGAATYHYWTLQGVSLGVPSVAHPTLGLGLATLGLTGIATAAHVHSAKKASASGSSSASSSVSNSVVSDLQSGIADIKAKLEAPPVASAPAVSAEQFNALQQEVLNLKSSLASPASSPAEPVAASQPAPQQVSAHKSNTHIAK